jgi:hypothetical protein
MKFVYDAQEDHILIQGAEGETIVPERAAAWAQITQANALKDIVRHLEAIRFSMENLQGEVRDIAAKV